MRDDLLNTSCLENIHQRDMKDVRTAYGTKLKVSKSITACHGVGKSRSRANFAVRRTGCITPLRTMYMNRLIKQIHPIKTKTVPYHSSPVPLLMIYLALCNAKNKKFYIHQETTEDILLLVRLRIPVSKDATTTVCAETDKNMTLVQKKYNLHNDRHVRFFLIFKHSEEVYLGRPSPFGSAAKKSAAEGYDKFCQESNSRLRLYVSRIVL